MRREVGGVRRVIRAHLLIFVLTSSAYMSSRSRAKRSAETAEDEVWLVKQCITSYLIFDKKPPRKKTAPEKARAKQSASKRQRRVEPESESETATQDTSESYEQSSIEREEQQIPTKRRVSARKRKQPVFYDEHVRYSDNSHKSSYFVKNTVVKCCKRLSPPKYLLITHRRAIRKRAIILILYSHFSFLCIFPPPQLLKFSSLLLCFLLFAGNMCEE